MVPERNDYDDIKKHEMSDTTLTRIDTDNLALFSHTLQIHAISCARQCGWLNTQPESELFKYSFCTVLMVCLCPLVHIWLVNGSEQIGYLLNTFHIVKWLATENAFGHRAHS